MEENNINSLEENENLTTSDNKKQNKKSKKKIVIFLVLLCILGMGGYFFVSLSNKEPEKKTVKKETKEVYSEYRLSGNSLEDFDLYFLKLENDSKNMVYSPLSIKYALEMLAEGSSGNTKKQLDDIIGDYKSNNYPSNEHMSFANAMFIRDSYKDKVKESYTNNLKTKYNAEVIIDPFASADNINNWVSDKTFKLINKLVDDVSDNDFFLINALAIDMNWKNQIHCANGHQIPCVNNGRYYISYAHEKLDDDSQTNYSVTEYEYAGEDEFYGGYTRKNVFNGKEKTKGADVLADFNKYDIIKDLGEDKIREILKPEYEEWLKTEYGKNDLPVDQALDNFIKELKENYGKAANSTDFFVHEDDSVRVFAKDLQEYEGKTLQYVGIMPKKDELANFVKNTNKNELNTIIKELKEVNIDSFEEGYVTRIRGFIPFFKFEYELNLMEDLNKLGVNDVFDEKKANLSKMVDDKATINKAVHKADIEFSNDGIKAAAATAMGGYGSAAGPKFEHLFKVPVKEIDVTFDKPYMYIIRDKDSGEVWFTGTVYEPISK